MKLAPIPPRMRHLPRDPRGYPIPVIVMRDDRGRAHFTMNDRLVAETLARTNCCGICGQPLGGSLWFIGGPASAFHPQGGYYDNPVHMQCGRFALQACPYLSRRMLRRIEKGATLRPNSFDGKVVIADDPTVHPDQPAVFVFACTDQTTRDAVGHFIPRRPWQRLEFWRDGQRIDAAAARAQVAAAPTPAAPFSELHWQDQ